LDSIKKADLLNKHWENKRPLNVFIQINTSAEDCTILFKMLLIVAKSGVQPSECLEFAKHIISNCKNLSLLGLMTIGSPENSNTDDNPDFTVPPVSISPYT
jgi:uncharacterized pyridoxal phosphate-containing UPF0001 family protein